MLLTSAPLTLASIHFIVLLLHLICVLKTHAFLSQVLLIAFMLTLIFRKPKDDEDADYDNKLKKDEELIPVHRNITHYNDLWTYPGR